MSVMRTVFRKCDFQLVRKMEIVFNNNIGSRIFLRLKNDLRCIIITFLVLKKSV